MMGSSSAKKSEVYCWPWVGIVANIQDEPNSCGFAYRYGYWLKKFSKYKPLEIEMFCGNNHRKAQAVLRFDNDMSGFKNAMEFEKSFEADGRSKKEWDEQRLSPGSSLYGWFAREDDYISGGPVGDYLQRNGELKKIVVHGQEITNEIDLQNGKLDEKTLFYEETRKSQRLAREHVKKVSDELELLTNELLKKKKRLDSCSIKLENKMKSLHLWRAELKNRETLIKGEVQKLEEEKEKMKEKEENLEYLEDLNTQLVTKERQSNDELQEARKELIASLTDTPISSCANIGIKRMGEIDVKAFMNACTKKRYSIKAEEEGIKDVKAFKNTCKKRRYSIEEEEEGIEDVKAFKNACTKKRYSIKEKELEGIKDVKVFTNEWKRRRCSIEEKEEGEEDKEEEGIEDVKAFKNACTKKRYSIKEKEYEGIKDIKAFTNVCKRRRHSIEEEEDEQEEGIQDVKEFKNACTKKRYSIEEEEEAEEEKTEETKIEEAEIEIEALKLCSLWQEKLKDPSWHPFQIVTNTNGNAQYMVKENDKMLVELKEEYGDGAFDALKEIQEYNPSGCCVVPELWNFLENRKATLKEVITCTFDQLKKLKCKRRGY